MADKLKCPFCGEELVDIPNIAQTRTIGFRCYNIQCKAFNHFMPVFIMQALIQAQQDLAKAIDGLKWIANNHLADNPVRVEQLRQYARQILEQIEHKE